LPDGKHGNPPWLRLHNEAAGTNGANGANGADVTDEAADNGPPWAHALPACSTICFSFAGVIVWSW
jgi:hypothetical protein